MAYRIKLLLKNSFLAFLLLSCFAAADVAVDKDYSPYPQPDSGYVTDYANLLSDSEEERIERWLWQVENKSQVEIIVVVIDSLSRYQGTNNRSIESFATALFDTYGIGNMPKNDGVLLLIARNDRKARIELGAGYGRTRDADAQRIMDKIIIPQFRRDDYVGGITDGTEALIEEFASMRVTFPWHVVWLGLGGLVSLIIGFSLIKSGKKGWGYVFIGIGIVLILLAIYIAVRIAQSLPDSDSDSWGAGGSGGFGGGFSGGGGASGSW